MKRVNIYTYSTAKSPKAAELQCEAGGYVMEYKTPKGDATASEVITLQKMTAYQTQLHILKKALSRINTKCEVHIYTECPYVATGLNKWLSQWKSAGWVTARGDPVKNAAEWKELDALVQKHNHTLVLHVKEDHSYRNWLKDNVEKEKRRVYGKDR